MNLCPAGHASESDDYCDTCGAPIEEQGRGAAPDAAPAARPTEQPAQPTGVPCPNCKVENVPDALFCEACGYDFTTGTMPRPIVNPFSLPGDDLPAGGSPTPAARPDPAPVVDFAPEPKAPPAPVVDIAPPAPEPEPADTPESDETADGDAAAADEAQSAEDAPAGTSGAAASDQQDADGGAEEAAPDGHDVDQDAPEGRDSDEVSTAPAAAPDVPAGTSTPGFSTAPEPTAPEPTAPEPRAPEPRAPEPSAPAPRTPPPEPTPANPDVPFEWVAEMWVDPDWYREQDPPDPMPSPGLPEIVPLRRRSVLIGRESRSRNITPDIDCESDPGASRRQAQLTTDGRRWFVEDLDSSNGTYVAGAAEGLPKSPIRVGQRHELEPDDRIYLGAWTRLVIRRATPEDHESYS
ncbi:FHA domain-containing protein [Propionibacteriaceae bacterium Y2011]